MNNPMQPPGRRLWRNRNFNIFWGGQTFSVLGDAFALVAFPLLVLQATGSIAQMGLVTATFGVGQVVTGVFAGWIVDRLDRRRLLLCCDLLRTVLYLAIPLWWWLIGPQIWLIFVVTALGSCLGMTFQIAYVTAIANLVDSDQITEANGRTQATYAVAYVTGPLLAGIISASFGPTFAITLDAFSFALSTISVFLIRLRSQSSLTVSQPLIDGTVKATEQSPGEKRTIKREFFAGLHFLWHEPTLRSVAILLCLLSLLTSGVLDLFLFRLKHDLGQGDNIVGIIFGLASLGSLIGGLLISRLRKLWGFGVCWIGGFLLNCLVLALVGLASNLFLLGFLAICFTFSATLAGVASMSLRQEITPDHLLGRVTSAFWTISSAPGPIGAALFTALAEHAGTQTVLLLIGALGMFVVSAAFFTPIRQRYPERSIHLSPLPLDPLLSPIDLSEQTNDISS